jgi:GT2 family glycosyltransferase
MTDVGIVLLNHKGSHFIENLYLNIFNKIGIEPNRWIFLIVDNSLEENESRIVRDFAKIKNNVIFISSNENKGYAHGNNLGLRYLSENRIKYGLIINPDIVFLTQNFIFDFIDLIEINKSIGIIGPKLIDNKGNEISIFPKMNLINALVGSKKLHSESLAKQVYATMGCCLFVDTYKLNEIGFFDESTFLYREEQILAEKIINNKLLWYVLPNVEVLHNHTRKIQSTAKLLQHKIYEYRSTKIYFKKYLNYSNYYIFLYTTLFLLKTITYYNIVIILNLNNKLKKYFSPISSQ